MMELDKIDDLKAFALEIIAGSEQGEIDEWHEYEDQADVHIQTDEENEMQTRVYVYPIITGADGNRTTDTSKGCELF